MNSTTDTEKTKINQIINISFPKVEKKLNILSKNLNRNDRILLNNLNKEISDTLFLDYKRVLYTLNKISEKSVIKSDEEINITQCINDELTQISETKYISGVDSTMYSMSEILTKFQPKGEISLTYNSIQKKIALLNNNLDEVTTEKNLSMIDEFEFAQKFVIGIILFFILIAVVTSYITTKSIKKPLTKLQTTLNKMSKGELPEIKINNSRDEIGDMAITLSNVTNLLRKIILNIKRSSEKLSVLSQILSKRSIQISQGATEQAASVEEVSASIEQMISNIEQNMENANTAENIVNEAVNKIKINNENVSKSTTALEDILSKVTIFWDFDLLYMILC